MVNHPKNQPFKYDTLLKSLFESSANELLKSLGFSIDIQERLTPDLAELSSKLVPDFLYLANYQSDDLTEPCIIHFEFQSKNDFEMLYRMGEYYFRIKRVFRTQRYKIVQFLLYFGTANNLMEGFHREEIGRCELLYRFNLIDTNKENGAKYLNSENLDVNLLGFLCNLSEVGDLSKILENVLNKVRKNELNVLQDYVAKLMIISEIRDFSNQFEEVYKKMGIDIDLKKLPLAKDAYLEGKLEGKLDGIKKILQVKFSNELTKVNKLIRKIEKCKVIETLEKIMDSALKVKSIDEFEEILGEII